VSLLYVTIFKKYLFVQGASRETDVFEIGTVEQIERVEAWVGGN
jgi:hypothetical protein